MSNLIFPTLPGLAWEGRTRSPEFKTLVRTSASGLDSAVQLWVNPRWSYVLPFDVLRSFNPFTEYQTLLGFFLQVGACAQTWLFSDWEDNAVTGQPIATGDGATTAFQLVRTLGGFTEPVLMQNVVTAVYLNGVAQASTAWSVSNGVLTFTAAPGSAVAITADFSFYWRCRFTEDQVDADALYYKFWAMKKIEFRSVKLGSG
jgi:uncharacterized protein (TIGR02217 family)